MAKLKNTVNPLNWQIPIVNSDGTPTNEFMRKWGQQAFVNGSIPDLVTGQALHTVLAASPAGPSQPPSFRLLAVADIPNLLSLYDAAGAAAAALVSAEAFSSNASNLTSGTVAAARLPAATTAARGGVRPDGVTITIAGDVISAVGGGGGAASIQDDGTTVYLAVSDGDGQLVLDGAGDPVFMPEVFPATALANVPLATTAVFGLVKPDNATIGLVGGLLASKFNGLSLTRSANLTGIADSIDVTMLWDNIVLDTQGGYNAATGIYTPTLAGNYFFVFGVLAFSSTDCTYAFNQIKKNGTVRIGESDVGHLNASPSSSTSMLAYALVPMNGTTDNVKFTIQIRGAPATGNGVFGSNITSALALYLGP